MIDAKQKKEAKQNFDKYLEEWLIKKEKKLNVLLLKTAKYLNV